MPPPPPPPVLNGLTLLVRSPINCIYMIYIPFSGVLYPPGPLPFGTVTASLSFLLARLLSRCLECSPIITFAEGSVWKYAISEFTGLVSERRCCMRFRSSSSLIFSRSFSAYNRRTCSLSCRRKICSKNRDPI